MLSNRLKCILLIDDNPIQNYLNIRLLNNINAAENIRVCLNGKEALNFLVDYFQENNQAPDIILLDLYMPVANGFDFLKAYKDFDNYKNHDTRIIFLTASSESSEIEKIKMLGCELINKPLTEEKLYNVLKSTSLK